MSVARSQASMQQATPPLQQAHLSEARTPEAQTSQSQAPALPAQLPQAQTPRRPPRLLETPLDEREHPPTSRGLRRLAFACATCGTLVVPRHATRRLTVRPTPAGASVVITDSGTPRVQQDSVFADFVQEGGYRMAESSVLSTILGSKLQKFPVQPYQRAVLCAGCGAEVGYAVEDAHGRPLRIEGRPAYKMVYFKEGRGFVLRLADEEAWTSMAVDVPPAEIEPQPRHLEDLTALGRPVHEIRAEVEQDRRNHLLRSMRADETGAIQPRDSASPLSAIVHVLHGSSKNRASTRFVSGTSDSSLALLWALPFGRVVVVSPTLAALVGARVLSHEELLAAIASEVSHGEADRERAALYASRACEALIEGSVGSPAVEPLRSRVASVHGPRFVSAHGQGAGFPAEVHEFRQLAVMQEPPISLPADSGCSVLAHIADPSRPAYILVRMSRNSINVPLDPAETRRMQAALEAGRVQLWEALRGLPSGRGADAAYYELDIGLSQERVVSTRVPDCVDHLPVLLVRWGPRAQETAAALCRAKKGLAP
jgi:hypothetical protein